MSAVLLWAMLQNPVVPPRPADPQAEPLGRMPSPEEIGASERLRWRNRDYPPEEMIDFFARRRGCAVQEDEASTPMAEIARFLDCESLPREEEHWRHLYAGNEAVEDLLNADPRSVRLGRFVTTFDNWLPDISVRRLLQDGVDPQSGTPVSLQIETISGANPAVQITVSWGNVPARTIQIPAEDLPRFDPSSATVRMRPSGEHEGVGVSARFGQHRGYCHDGVEDDRPQVSIYFTRQTVMASTQGWPDCNVSYDRDLSMEIVPPR